MFQATGTDNSIGDRESNLFQNNILRKGELRKTRFQTSIEIIMFNISQQTNMGGVQYDKKCVKSGSKSCLQEWI